jgi:hypothetical protein
MIGAAAIAGISPLPVTVSLGSTTEGGVTGLMAGGGSGALAVCSTTGAAAGAAGDTPFLAAGGMTTRLDVIVRETLRGVAGLGSVVPPELLCGLFGCSERGSLKGRGSSIPYVIPLTKSKFRYNLKGYKQPLQIAQNSADAAQVRIGCRDNPVTNNF